MVSKEPLSFFFIGIGGAGMSALARILLAQGYKVAGSDASLSAHLTDLEKLGATVYLGHKAEQIDRHHPSQVVVSQTAIAADNCEMLRAKSLNIPIIFRSDLLAHLLEKQLAVVIAGTHGKTSTTGMTVTIMQQMGIDASYAIGGQIINDSSGGHAGTVDVFICEADESDGSLIKYSPNIAVITNIDPDHMDFFGTEQAYWEGFVRFSQKIQTAGVLIICIDTLLARRLLIQEAENLASRGVKIFPYTGQLASSVLPAELVMINQYLQAISSVKSYDAQTGKVIANIENEECAYTFFTSGIHMVANSLAAILAVYAVGQYQTGRQEVSPWKNLSPLKNLPAIAETVGSFPGTKRRCELRDSWANITIIDDYAHHPTEIAAVISGMRNIYPQSRILVLFQPHMFSRTRDLAAGFRQSLELADIVTVVDIYPAREQPIPGVSSYLITKDSTKLSYIPELHAAAVDIAQQARSGDIVLTMGAGTVTKYADEIAKTLRERFVGGSFSPTLKT